MELKQQLQEAATAYGNGELTLGEFHHRVVFIIANWPVVMETTNDQGVEWLWDRLSDKPKREPDLVVNEYAFTIEMYEPKEGGHAFKIKAEPLKPFGYFHCGYRKRGDAQYVLENLVQGFADVHYRVNFQTEGPYRMRETLNTNEASTSTVNINDAGI